MRGNSRRRCVLRHRSCPLIKEKTGKRAASRKSHPYVAKMLIFFFIFFAKEDRRNSKQRPVKNLKMFSVSRKRGRDQFRMSVSLARLSPEPNAGAFKRAPTRFVTGRSQRHQLPVAAADFPRKRKQVFRASRQWWIPWPAGCGLPSQSDTEVVFLQHSMFG